MSAILWRIWMKNLTFWICLGLYLLGGFGYWAYLDNNQGRELLFVLSLGLF